MTLEQMRQKVLDNRSDTVMANAFRNAFGISSRHYPRSVTITRADYGRRKESEREYRMLMHQTIGAMDRG